MVRRLVMPSDLISQSPKCFEATLPSATISPSRFVSPLPCSLSVCYWPGKATRGRFPRHGVASHVPAILGARGTHEGKHRRAKTAPAPSKETSGMSEATCVVIGLIVLGVVALVLGVLALFFGRGLHLKGGD